MHLRQHVGTDRVNLVAELGAQRIGLYQRPSRAIEIARVELLQEQLILLVQTAVQIVDGSVDAVVETAKRGVVRRRRRILDDRDDLRARVLRLLLDLGPQQLKGLQV